MNKCASLATFNLCDNTVDIISVNLCAHMSVETTGMKEGVEMVSDRAKVSSPEYIHLPDGNNKESS